MCNDIFQRTSMLLGEDTMNMLFTKHIAICGIGGVGSYVVETLTRSGIGKITVIDKDIIDQTNINRQILALQSTIAKDKVDVCKKRMLDINPSVNVTAIKENITKENINILLKEKVDYVVDTVDNIEAKIAIIKFCVDNNIKCISCMGMGNKLNPLDIRINDIYKTSMCPLAKIMRKRLREINIKKQKVVFSIEEPKPLKMLDTLNTLGSVSFVPSVAGIIITSEVIKDIINN